MTGSRLLWQIPWCILELFMQAGRKIQYIDPQTLQPYSALSRTNAPNLNNLWLSFSGREAPMKQSGLRSRRSLSPEPPVGRYQMMSGGWAMKIPGLWWVAWVPLPGSIVSIIWKFWVAWKAFVPQYLLWIPSDEPLKEKGQSMGHCSASWLVHLLQCPFTQGPCAHPKTHCLHHPWGF